MGERLRPVDLARAAGISAQQVRNYADAGVLPAVSRTASGYRRFDERHLRALLAYRALAAGQGPDAARAVLAAVHAGDVAHALALVDAGHAALHERRRALEATAEAVEALAVQDPDAATSPRTAMRVGELAAYLGVRPSALRVWESAGLLAPARDRGTGYRRYGPADVRDARLVAMLRQARYPLPRARDILDGLRRTGSVTALRAAVAERRAELDRRSRAMIEAAGHLDRYLTGYAGASR